MTPDQERAHNVLHGQTLLIEWREYRQRCDQVQALYAAARARKELWIKEGGSKYAEGDALMDRAEALWAKAVRAQWGHIKVNWYFGGSCEVAGEVYEP